MIVVEGPDGAGKTTLIQKLSEELEIPVAPRVVAQDTTTNIDMKQWVEDNLRGGAQPIIFDRYRLISETIYGPILRSSAQPGFTDYKWMEEVTNSFYDQVSPFIIYCLPPLAEVKANIENDPDNVVVKDKIEQIYSAYAARASLDNTFAQMRVWDYTNPGHTSENGKPYFMPTLRRYVKFLKENS